MNLCDSYIEWLEDSQERLRSVSSLNTREQTPVIQLQSSFLETWMLVQNINIVNYAINTSTTVADMAVRCYKLNVNFSFI
jgi:hypothetical protein